MVIYSKVKLGVSPDMNALASLIIMLIGIGVIFAGWMMRRAERQRLLDRALAEQG
jgi:putrescine transport system permease protein